MCRTLSFYCGLLFFFNDPAPTDIYTLSLHDALPISVDAKGEPLKATSYMAVGFYVAKYVNKKSDMDLAANVFSRSEERFSRNAETDLVCRLLLEKKKKQSHRENLVHVQQVDVPVDDL